MRQNSTDWPTPDLPAATDASAWRDITGLLGEPQISLIALVASLAALVAYLVLRKGAPDHTVPPPRPVTLLLRPRTRQLTRIP